MKYNCTLQRGDLPLKNWKANRLMTALQTNCFTHMWPTSWGHGHGFTWGNRWALLQVHWSPWRVRRTLLKSPAMMVYLYSSAWRRGQRSLLSGGQLTDSLTRNNSISHVEESCSDRRAMCVEATAPAASSSSSSSSPLFSKSWLINLQSCVPPSCKYAPRPRDE